MIDGPTLYFLFQKVPAGLGDDDTTMAWVMKIIGLRYALAGFLILCVLAALNVPASWCVAVGFLVAALMVTHLVAATAMWAGHLSRRR